MSNSLFSLIACFGKIGYFPLFLVIAFPLFPTPYLSSMLEPFNKWAYLFILLFISNISIFFQSYDYRLIVINFFYILFYIIFIITLKHLLLISTYILFLLIYLLITIEEEFLSSLYSIKYSLLNSVLINCFLFHVFYISIRFNINIVHAFLWSGLRNSDDESLCRCWNCSLFSLFTKTCIFNE